MDSSEERAPINGDMQHSEVNGDSVAPSCSKRPKNGMKIVGSPTAESLQPRNLSPQEKYQVSQSSARSSLLRF